MKLNYMLNFYDLPCFIDSVLGCRTTKSYGSTSRL